MWSPVMTLGSLPEHGHQSEHCVHYQKVTIFLQTELMDLATTGVVY